MSNEPVASEPVASELVASELVASEPLASAGSVAHEGAARTKIAQSANNGIEFLFKS